MVIATYQRRSLLERTLPTVLRQRFDPTQFEVIVVVDGSSDGTVEMLASVQSPCGLRVLTQANHGQGTAMNAGAAVARGELLMFLADDVVCSPELIEQHVSAHRELADAVVFGPVRVAPDAPRSGTSLLMREWADRYFDLLDGGQEPSWPAHTFVAHNSSLRRATFLEEGGFDAGFARMSEDAELGTRLWKRGTRFVYRREAVAHHVYARSSEHFIDAEAERYGRAEVRMARKHPEYRLHCTVANLGHGPWHRRLVRQLLVRAPLAVDRPLAFGCAIAERFSWSDTALRLAARLLKVRWRVRVLAAARRETGSWKALAAEFGRTLPVLLYHHVGPPARLRGLSIDPPRFRRDMNVLASLGYEAITPRQWEAWRLQASPLPPRPVLITLDDGYADTCRYVAPVLATHDYPAVMFVVSGLVGRTNEWDERVGGPSIKLATWDALRKLAATNVELGSHGRSHRSFAGLAPDELRAEISSSKEELSAVTSPVSSLAYPFGHAPADAVALVKQSYSLAFTTEPGINDLSTDPHRLRRIMVQPNTIPMDLWLQLRLGFSPLLRSRALVARLRSRLRGA